jgi:hypothetical protein
LAARSQSRGSEPNIHTQMPHGPHTKQHTMRWCRFVSPNHVCMFGARKALAVQRITILKLSIWAPAFPIKDMRCSMKFLSTRGPEGRDVEGLLSLVGSSQSDEDESIMPRRRISRVGAGER